MATVVKAVEEVVVKTAQQVYKLTLTQDEAETLSVVLAKVGGDPDRTGRGNTEAIFDALEAAGVRYELSKHYGRSSGYINFS